MHDLYFYSTDLIFFLLWLDLAWSYMHRVLASRIWRALHESVNFVHDPEKQYKSLSVAHKPGGLRLE